MKTYTQSTALPLSALAVCFLLPSALGQAPVPSPKPQTHRGVSLTRTRVQFSPTLLAAEQKSQEALARGEAFMQAGDLDDAIDAFQQALSYEPDNALAYQRLAEAQTATGKLNEAADSYRTVLYHWPGKNWSNVQNGDPVIHMQFALLLLRLNKRAEALSVYQHGYQLLQLETAGSANTAASTLLPTMLAAPNFTPAQLEAAADTVTAIHKYNWVSQSLSLTDFQRVVKLQPDSAVGHFYLGQIYKFQSSHAADAVKEFRKAAQLGGPEMQPFVEKAQKEGSREFTILRPAAP